MERAVQVLRERGAAGCVLLGDPKFYQRFGFRAHPGLRLAEVPPDHFLALSLGAALPAGTVSYHESFYVRRE
jgi:predicted N-acetyltransferase YhbS